MRINQIHLDRAHRDGLRVRALEVFAGVEEVAGIEGAFDLGVEMTERRGGGYFPPRFFG